MEHIAHVGTWMWLNCFNRLLEYRHPPRPTYPRSVRPAKLKDVERMAVVAVAGFYYSQFFGYERPDAAKYPVHTLASYENMFREAVFDPDTVVLVVEDTFERGEEEDQYEPLEKACPSLHSPKRGNTIVAVSSLKLLPGSKRRGQFQSHEFTAKKRSGHHRTCTKDQDPTATNLISKHLIPKERRVLKDSIVIDNMVTHPHYWKRGHATRMTKWYMDLAAMDDVGLGVSAAKMGEDLYRSLGFQEECIVEVPGYKAHREPIRAWLGLWKKTMTENGTRAVDCSKRIRESEEI